MGYGSGDFRPVFGFRHIHSMVLDGESLKQRSEISPPQTEVEFMSFTKLCCYSSIKYAVPRLDVRCASALVLYCTSDFWTKIDPKIGSNVWLQKEKKDTIPTQFSTFEHVTWAHKARTFKQMLCKRRYCDGCVCQNVSAVFYFERDFWRFKKMVKLLC